MKPEGPHRSIYGLPRILVLNEEEAVDVVVAASDTPQVFPGLNAAVYLDLKPPFVVGTDVSERAIEGFAKRANQPMDPDNFEFVLTAQAYLAELGIEAMMRRAA
jgi:hypothetical protein